MAPSWLEAAEDLVSLGPALGRTDAFVDAKACPRLPAKYLPWRQAFRTGGESLLGVRRGYGGRAGALWPRASN